MGIPLDSPSNSLNSYLPLDSTVWVYADYRNRTKYIIVKIGIFRSCVNRSFPWTQWQQIVLLYNHIFSW